MFVSFFFFLFFFYISSHYISFWITYECVLQIPTHMWHSCAKMIKRKKSPKKKVQNKEEEEKGVIFRHFHGACTHFFHIFFFVYGWWVFSISITCAHIYLFTSKPFSCENERKKIWFDLLMYSCECVYVHEYVKQSYHCHLCCIMKWDMSPSHQHKQTFYPGKRRKNIYRQHEANGILHMSITELFYFIYKKKVKFIYRMRPHVSNDIVRHYQLNWTNLHAWYGIEWLH